MNKKIGLAVILMLVMTTIPVTGFVGNAEKSTVNRPASSEKSKMYWFCYIEAQGTTYAGIRTLYLPNIINNMTFCLGWRHRFVDNGTVSLYRSKGGTLLYQMTDVREFLMSCFWGYYNVNGAPLILKGRVLCMRVYDYWTPPK
jgi:hypothetical protein